MLGSFASACAEIKMTVAGPIPPFFLLLVSTALIAAVGCSSTPKPAATGNQSLSSTDERIFIGDTIEKNYDPHVIMKRAESFFERGNYPEAIIEYQHFLDLHRVHTLAPYAQYKLGESHFKMVQTVDRDPEPAYNALEAFEKLRKDFPGSRYDAEVAVKIRECHQLMAQRDFFVGQFYYRREAYLAAAHRFESVLREYPNMEVASDSLYYLALTYHELGAEDWARDNLLLLAERHPTHKHQKESRRLLAKLNAELPTQPKTFAALSPHSASAQRAVSSTNTSYLAHTNGASPVTHTAALSRPSPRDTPPETILCQLGTWCGANGSALAQEVPAPSARSPLALTPQPALCRLGTWC